MLLETETGSGAVFALFALFALGTTALCLLRPASHPASTQWESVGKTRTGPGGCTSNQPKPASNRPSTMSEN